MRCSEPKGAKSTRFVTTEANRILAAISMAMVLMVGSGLMLRSFQHLSGTDLGFRTHGIMSVRVNLPRTDYPTEELVFGFRERLEEQLRSRPGMEFAVTWGPGLPGQAGSYTTAVPEGKIVESQLEACVRDRVTAAANGVG